MPEPGIDLATFLTVVYCVVDDLYKSYFAPLKPRRPGPKVKMSDSEVLTVTLLAQWQQDRSEAGFVGYVRRKWHRFFPRMLSQSDFNRRARDLAGVLCLLGPAVSQLTELLLSGKSGYVVLDTVPVPLMRRCRGDRHRLFAEEAQVGRGGSDNDWYYGVQLLLVVSASGSITGFVLGPANTEERWLAEALLRWRHDPSLEGPNLAELLPILGPSHQKGGKRVGPTGPILPWLGAGQAAKVPYLGDLGFRGKAWIGHWDEHYAAEILTKAQYAELESAKDRRLGERWLASLRQVIETANGSLDRVFGLKYPRARSLWGLLTRLAAKVAAYNMAVYINQLLNRPTFSFINPITDLD